MVKATTRICISTVFTVNVLKCFKKNVMIITRFSQNDLLSQSMKKSALESQGEI